MGDVLAETNEAGRAGALHLGLGSVFLRAEQVSRPYDRAVLSGLGAPGDPKAVRVKDEQPACVQVAGTGFHQEHPPATGRRVQWELNTTSVFREAMGRFKGRIRSVRREGTKGSQGNEKVQRQEAFARWS